ERVALTGRTGHGFAVTEQSSPLRGVVAAEVGGLAHLRERVIQRLATLALQQREEARRPLLQEVGGPLQRGRPGGCRRRGPAFEIGARGGDSSFRLCRRRIGDA